MADLLDTIREKVDGQIVSANTIPAIEQLTQNALVPCAPPFILDM